MPSRTSIELHPDGCRIVEVRAAGRRTGATGEVRVEQFVADVPADAAPLARVRTQRQLSKHATLTIWGLRSTHHLLRLPPAKPADLERLAAREARKDIAALEADGQPATIAIALGAEVHVGSNRRREVALVAAASADINERLQSVTDAGFIVDAVMTPALALAEAARLDTAIPAGTAAVYVALNAGATCIAIVRDGLLLFAREMPWGHASGGADDTDVAERLASELRRSTLFFKQTFRAPVEHVVLCGDASHLRALIAPLAVSLEIAVHALDSLDGIDAAHLSHPADRLASAIAPLRVAIAAARTTSPNLLPPALLTQRQSRTQALRLAAGIAAAIALLAASYSVVDRSAREQRRERRAIEQQLAVLEPEAARVASLRQEYTIGAARHAALAAFSSEGPRLARVLEAVSHAASPDLVLTSIAVVADGAHWQLMVKGVAVADEAASGQAVLNQFLHTLAVSPFVGVPAEPPAVRVISGSVGTSGKDTGVAIPDWMSGVEFSLQFTVAR